MRELKNSTHCALVSLPDSFFLLVSSEGRNFLDRCRFFMNGWWKTEPSKVNMMEASQATGTDGEEKRGQILSAIDARPFVACRRRYAIIAIQFSQSPLYWCMNIVLWYLPPWLGLFKLPKGNAIWSLAWMMETQVNTNYLPSCGVQENGNGKAQHLMQFQFIVRFRTRADGQPKRSFENNINRMGKSGDVSEQPFLTMINSNTQCHCHSCFLGSGPGRNQREWKPVEYRESGCPHHCM